MLEWSTKPQFFYWQHSLRTLFTSGTLRARASSSDLLMRPDIDIIAEDSELIASARSISSTAHSRVQRCVDQDGCKFLSSTKFR